MTHKVFERTATLEEIRDAALRAQCGKLDREYVMAVKTKEQLLEYLKGRDCPALKYLEAKLLMGREYLDGAELPVKTKRKIVKEYSGQS